MVLKLSDVSESRLSCLAPNDFRSIFYKTILQNHKISAK